MVDDKKSGTHYSDEMKPEELYVVELDERLEFGATLLDSDLEADDNTGCHNDSQCDGKDNHGCVNDIGC